MAYSYIFINFFNKMKSFFSKVKQYLIKNKLFRYFNYFLIAVCIFLLFLLHIKVFVKKHSNPNALKGGIFEGMFPICVQSDPDASDSDIHVTLEGERLTGFEVLLLKEIANKQGKELELTINTFAGLLGDIKTGKADITASCLAITDERKAEVDFSIPYNMPMNGFVVRRDNEDFKDFEHNTRVQDQVLFDHLNDLCATAQQKGENKSFTCIAVTASFADTGFLGKGYFQKNLNNPDTIKKETSSSDIGPNLAFIRNKKADIFVVDDVIARGNTEGDKDLKYFILESTKRELQTAPNGIGVVVKKGDTQRQKEVNEALVKIFGLQQKDGQIQDIKYIITRLDELKAEKDENKTEEIERLEKQLNNIRAKIKEFEDRVYKATNKMRNIKTFNLWQKMYYNFPTYKKGLYNTLLISIDGLLIGFLLALFLVGAKTKATNTRTHNIFVKACYKMISKCVDTYIWLLKGVPISAQAMLVWFSTSFWWPSKNFMPGLFPGGFPQITQIQAALLVITLNAGASLTIILLQNIKFVDKGQIEAAFSLGMTQKQTFYNIIFPQSLKKSVPFTITQFISNIKDCTFFAFIGLVEMGWIANRNMGITADVVTPFVILSIIYLALIQCSNTLAKYLEKKLNPSLRHTMSV